MTDAKVLFVDDDASILAAFRRQLRGIFDVHTASNGAEGLDRLRTEACFAVIVADMRMPLMTGTEFLAQARIIAPNSVRMMLTGNADQQTAIDRLPQSPELPRRQAGYH